MTRSASLRRLASALLLAVLARPAAAGVDRFTPTGPLNGDLIKVLVDPFHPGSLLALTAGTRLFRSDDGGHRWAFSGAGLAGVQAIAADAANPGSFYAISLSEVFHSTDGGRHWTQVASGQSFPALFTPHSRSYAVLTALPTGPGAPATLLATNVQTVQRSEDGGVTWSTVFTTSFLATNWGPVADPTDPLLSWLSPPGGGLLESTNAGQTWAPVPSFPAPQAMDLRILVLPTTPETILAGSWRSPDGGVSWSQSPVGVEPVAYETQTPSIVYGLGGPGLLFSTDAGATWTPRPVPPPGTPLAAPGTRTLYAVGRNDISTSPDRGRHWSLTTESGVTPFILLGSPGSPTRLRFQPGDPAIAYAVFGTRAFRSADGGATWASFALDLAPLQSTVVQDLAIDTQNPAAVYLATGQGVFHSADAGASWDHPTPQSFARLDFAGRTLLGAGCGIERSTNGGRTWKVALSCPSPGSGYPRSITGLLVDPRNSNTVYAEGFEISPVTAAPPPHVWQSLDNGASWKVLVADGNVVAVDPTRSGRLYTTHPSGLERSDDNGRTFRAISNFPADAGLTVNALLVDAATPTTLYAGTSGQGVWRSTDRGATWAPVDGRIDVRDLVLHPTLPHWVYALGADGLFQSRFTEP
ncbi:MAG TPA: hypothetical protein VFE33_27625 [Thermoanaerobaculia bacterium]|nr:hypothetical protein [Thermoanaerobaculia bacterium]